MAVPLLLGLAACRGGDSGPDEPGDPDERLVEATFEVIDSVTSVALAGATVLAGGSQGVTNGEGRVILRVPAGPVEAVAVAAGYDASDRVTSGPGVPVLLALRPAPPWVSECRTEGSRLVALASDYAGRKTILRRARSEVTLEGPDIGSVTVPVVQWTWKAVDTWSYVVTVPLPGGEVTRATWRVYDRELNVAPLDCVPGAPPGTF
jgi:hypothetical protein